MVKRPSLVIRCSLLVILLSGIALAQDISFRATVDKDKVALDDHVELTLTVTGSQDTGSPQLPQLDEFSVVSSGSSSQFSFINGKMSASKNFTYILIPLKEGKFTIPSISIDAEGKTLKSEPIAIEVAAGGKVPQQRPSMPGQQPSTPQAPPSTPAGLKERLFIEVTTDKQSTYVGEQITMTFKLYVRTAIDNLQYTPPVTKGFVTEQMGQQREYQDVRNGITYNVIELKTAIFPASAGELTIEPAKVKCDLLVREQRKRRRGGVFDEFDEFFEDPFFSSYVRYPIELESESVKINVNPPPEEGKSAVFKGAVGTFDLSVEAEPATLKAGEPINLTMTISGAGNITQIAEPIIKDITGFKTYESEVKTDITGRDPRIAGKKIFQKIIIPQSENVKEIPGIEFSWFDPLNNKYFTITKGPIPITVQPAPKKETSIVELIKEAAPEEEEEKKAVKLLANDIHYIESSPGKFTKISGYWYKNILLWISIILAPLIILIFSYRYNIHKTKLQFDTAYAKAKGAGKITRQLLDEAIKYHKQDKSKEFYDAVAKAVQKFIGDRLNAAPGLVTASNLDNLLNPKGLKEDIIKSIKTLFDNCDLARFGAYTSSQGEMKQVLKETEKIIAILNKRL